MAWNKEAMILFHIGNGPKVLGLDHSTPKKMMAPKKIKNMVPTSMILVCNFKSTNRRTFRCDHISKAARYPKPPITIRAIVLILNNTSPTMAYGRSLSKNTKPALQKVEMACIIPVYNAACPI